MEIIQMVNDRMNHAANQFIIKHKGETFFQSYKTMCAKISKNKKVFLNKEYFIDSNLSGGSKTTNKHLYIFLRENGFPSIRNKKDVTEEIENGNFVLTNVEL